MNVAVVLLLLVLLPFAVKLVFLYIAYAQWALAFPIPFSVRLFGRGPVKKVKKPPIGFIAGMTEEDADVVVGKKKK